MGSGGGAAVLELRAELGRAASPSRWPLDPALPAAPVPTLTPLLGHHLSRQVWARVFSILILPTAEPDRAQSLPLFQKPPQPLYPRLWTFSSWERRMGEEMI